MQEKETNNEEQNEHHIEFELDELKSLIYKKNTKGIDKFVDKLDLISEIDKIFLKKIMKTGKVSIGGEIFDVNLTDIQSTEELKNLLGDLQESISIHDNLDDQKKHEVSLARKEFFG